MSRSLVPTTQRLWLSCPTLEASAPRRRPNPRTNPRPTLRFLPCRAKTAAFRMSRPGSASFSPERISSVQSRCLVRICRSISPITGVSGFCETIRKSFSVTGSSRTVCANASGTGGGSAAANSSSETGTPPQTTCRTDPDSSASTSTRSARCPGATSPRSARPNARAADQEAAR